MADQVQLRGGTTAEHATFTGAVREVTVDTSKKFTVVSQFRPDRLSMFFVHDGGDTQSWRLKKHAERDFWEWVASWAVCVRHPSDLGYDDGAYQLPALHLHEHRVQTDHALAQQSGLGVAAVVGGRGLRLGVATFAAGRADDEIGRAHV